MVNLHKYGALRYLIREINKSNHYPGDKFHRDCFKKLVSCVFHADFYSIFDYSGCLQDFPSGVRSVSQESHKNR